MRKIFIFISFLLSTTLFSQLVIAAATLSGTVFDAADNITGVYPVAIDLLDPDTGDSLAGVTNNPDGSYEFTGITPGEYKIFFNAVDAANHFIDELHDEIPCDNGACDRAALGSTINLVEGNNFFDEELSAGAILSGTIVDAANGTLPVHPVYISLMDPVTGADVGGIQNNPDGTYSTGGFIPGEYTFFFNAFEESGGYVDELYDEIITCDNGGCDIANLGDTLVLVAGVNILDEDLALAPTISGTVTAEVGGAQLEGIQICVSRKSDEFRLACINTDGSGFYQLTIVEPRDDLVIWTRYPLPQPYFAEVYLDQPCCDIASGTSIDVTGGDQVVDLMLTRSASISGVVSSSVGDGSLPGRGGRVRLYSVADDVQVAVAFVDNVGAYTLSGFGPGSYYVLLTGFANNLIDELYDGADGVYCPQLSCDKATGTQFVFAGTEDYPNINAILDPGSQFTGNVSFDGNPLDNVFINFYAENGLYAGFGRTANDGSGDYVTNAGFPPGNYYAANRWVKNGTESGNEAYVPMTYPNRFCGEPCEVTTGDIFAADGTSTVPNIDFEFADISTIVQSISGNITDANTTLPVANMPLWAFDTDCNYINFANSDENGDYVMELQNPGYYYLFVIANDAWFINQQSPYMNQQYPGIDMFDSCYPALNDVTLGEAIVVADNEKLTGKDFVLNPGAVIRGTISDANGVLANETARAQLYSTSGEQQIVSTNMEGDGSYRIGGVMPGTYNVVLSSDSLGLIDERHDDVKCPRNSCAPELGEVVEILTGLEEITGIDAILDSGAVIRGNLTDGVSGDPIAGYCLYIYTEGGIYAGIGCTDENGNYESSIGLPDGNYRLSNQLWSFTYRDVADGYIPQVWTNDGSFLNCGVECDFTLGDTFTVNGLSPVENIDLAMYKAGTLSGTLSGEGIGPIDSVGIIVAYQNGVFNKFANTDSGGNWSLQLDPGLYTIWLTTDHSLGPYVRVTWNGAPGGSQCPLGTCAAEDIMQLEVGSDPMTGMDVELSLGIKITGTVTDSDSLTALSFESVELWNSDGSFFASVPMGNILGNFNSSAIPAGSYYAATSAAGIGEGFIDELWNDIACDANTCDPNNQAATLVSPTPGETLVLDFLLDQGRKISGTVTAQDGGAPLEDIQICVGHKVYTDVRECAVTDSSGNYEIGGFVFINDFVVYTEDVGGQAFYLEMYDSLDCCDVANGTSVDLTGADAVINFALATSGLIGGFVKDNVTDQPLGNITMQLYNQECELIETPHSTTDDGNFIGNYRISAVPDGTYHVFARGADQGYINERFPDQKMFNICDEDIGSGQAIIIENQSQVLNVDFELDPGASISGFVSDINGVLANGDAIIRVYDGLTERQLVGLRNWEEDGSYKLAGVMPGSYHVILSSRRQGLVDERFDDIKCPRNSCDSALGVQVLVALTEDITGIDAVLDPGAVFRGRITDSATGEGVPGGYCVGFYLDTGNYAGFACSDEDGYYESSTAFPEGQYLASNQFKINEYEPVKEGYQPQVWTNDGSFGDCGDPCDFFQGDVIVVDGLAPVEGIDLVMRKGSTISGQVRFNSVGVEGASVSLLDTFDAQEIKAVFTDASGNYTINGLAAGSYYLRTNNSFGYDDYLYHGAGNISCNPGCNPFDGGAVPVTGADDISGIEFDLTQAATISGTVTAPNASPLAGVKVDVYNVLGDLVANGSTNADGDYVIDGLSAGDFYIRTRNGSGFINILYNGLSCAASCDVLQGQSVVLAQGATASNIDMQLIPGGSISGVVEAGSDDSLPPPPPGQVAVAQAAGEPLPGATVKIYDQSGALVATIVTDGKGAYLADGLAAGDYYILTTNPGYVGVGADGSNCQGSCTVQSTIPVTLTENQALQNDVVLSPGESLDVLVLEHGGSDIEGITVIAYDDQGFEITRGNTQKLSADLSGNPTNLTLTGIAAGNVWLATSNEMNFYDMVYNGIYCNGLCNPTAGTRLTLGDGSITSPVRFSLVESNKISGTVYQASSIPLQGVAGVDVQLYTMDGVYFTSRTTGVGGVFEFSGMRNGDYRIRTGGNHGLINRVYDGDICTPELCSIDSGSVLSLANNDIQGIDFTLETGNVLTGYARDPAGNRIYGYVELFSASGLQLVRRQIEGDGTFNFAGLANGSYFVYLDAVSRYLTSGTSCHTHSFPYERHCNSYSIYSTNIDTLFNGMDCPNRSCDITSGTAIVVGEGASFSASANVGMSATGEMQLQVVPSVTTLTMIVQQGSIIRGTLKNWKDEALGYKLVYFFNEAGKPAGKAITNALGEFESESAFPDGTYFAATNRAAEQWDDRLDAQDAEAGVGEGLQDQVYGGYPCNGICAPSLNSGIGQPIVVSGADKSGIDIVLNQAPAIALQKLTNGVHAPTANSGDAPAISAGATVTWTYTLTNTGGDDLQQLSVTDNRGVSISCPSTMLAVGVSIDCTGSGTAVDLSADPFNGVLGNCRGVPDSRMYQNVGSVTAQTAGGTGVNAEDFSHYCNPLEDLIFSSGFE
jgi:hypothetical protein